MTALATEEQTAIERTESRDVGAGKAVKKTAKSARTTQDEKPLTLSQVARELERQAATLEDRRAAVAETEATILALQKAMRTMADEIGKRK